MLSIVLETRAGSANEHALSFLDRRAPSLDLEYFMFSDDRRQQVFMCVPTSCNATEFGDRNTSKYWHDIISVSHVQHGAIHPDFIRFCLCSASFFFFFFNPLADG